MCVRPYHVAFQLAGQIHMEMNLPCELESIVPGACCGCLQGFMQAPVHIDRRLFCMFTLAVNPFDCSLAVQGLVQVHRQHPSIRLLPDQCLEAATLGLPARHIFMIDCMPVLKTDRPFHPHALFRI